VDDSFADYVAQRGDALLRFAYVLTGSRHLAEDVVQEVLVRILARWRGMSHVEQPDAYLRTAIVRQFVSWRRLRARHEVPLGAVTEAAAPTDTAGGHAARDEVWRALATLPPKQRAVLVLRFYEDLSDAQIADVLGCQPSTVRVHASRGLARLRGLMPSQRPQQIGGRS
jgi:RNA polymerase sigma-70 factor (sigma-E family)